MQVSAREISDLLKGVIEGNPDVLVNKPSKIEEGEPGSICFLANPKYEHFAYETKASVILVNHTFVASKPIAATLIRVENVYACVAQLLEKFGSASTVESGISPQAVVHPTVQKGKELSVGHFSVVESGTVIGDQCSIFSQVYIGENVKLGNRVTIYPGVKIYKDCEIGDNCIIHSNTVIGSDGFGFVPNQETGQFEKMQQIGNVVIEENVEIGANTVIDRATMGSTVISAGVKLDNLIQIAHNVVVGKNTVIAAQAGIAGSSKIGEGCMLGGQTGIAGHIEIANRTKIQAQSGINKTIVKEGNAFYGSPALPYNDYVRSYVIFRSLPNYAKKIDKIEDVLKENGLLG